jgi:hypothetical protein
MNQTYRYVGHFKLIIAQSKLTISGMNCLFKTYYGKHIENMLSQDFKIKFKKDNSFYGKQIRFNYLR